MKMKLTIAVLFIILQAWACSSYTETLILKKFKNTNSSTLYEEKKSYLKTQHVTLFTVSIVLKNATSLLKKDMPQKAIQILQKKLSKRKEQSKKTKRTCIIT